MYLPHFGLDQSPFGITPNPTFFYAGSKRGAILEALIYAVTHGEGIIKVTGEVGSGKTMLCRMLESLLPKNIEVIYLVNPTLSREEVVYAIAGELELATGGKRPDEVIRLLQHDLIARHAAGKQVVLLVEEAQAMPLDTLEEIRLFSNLETARHKLLQIVLFGQPELDESLNLPRMRQLKERITHSFKVPPLAPQVIPEFLMFRMRAAGYHGPDIFSKRAIKRISSVSEGIVRRISILADKSLLAAFADNTHLIEAKHVKAAIADSEFSHTVATGQRRTVMLALLLMLGVVAAAIIGWNLFALSHNGATVAAVGPTLAADTAAVAEDASAVPEAFAPADLLRQRLTISRAWLKQQAPERYSIQLALMANRSRPDIERFLRKIQTEIGTEEVYVYPTRVGSAGRFGVLYGSFATREEAVRARSKLLDQRGYHPLLRTIRGINGEIERSHSNDLWSQ